MGTSRYVWYANQSSSTCVRFASYTHVWLCGQSAQNSVVHNLQSDAVSTAFHELFALCKSEQTQPYLLLSKLYALFDALTDKRAKMAQITATSTTPAIDDAIAYLKARFDQDIYLDDLAKTANLEKVYFIKKFKKQTGVSPMQFLIQYRVAHACRLLHTDLSLQEIAVQCGFRDFTNFLQRFKSVFGITPTQYKKRISN